MQYRALLCVLASMGVLAFAADAAQPAKSRYETRANHDPDGIGRFYLGREIAHVMGAEGIPWLERPQRDMEEQPEKVLDALKVEPGQVVADLGAGSGFYTFKLAKLVGAEGSVLAVDIQDAMLKFIRDRAARENITNIGLVRCTETDPHLPANRVDLVLMVDVYHELAYPYEVMANVVRALKPGGRVAFVEFRAEDETVPIKRVHKMSLEQLSKEMAAVGLEPLDVVETLPWQHIAVYGRAR
jgi:SAM-dependent methyltransferase